MIRLRKILLCNGLYYFILIIVLVLSYFRLENNSSNYSLKSKKFVGEVTGVKIDGDLLRLNLKDKRGEEVLANYYFNTKEEKKLFRDSFYFGDKLRITGEFSEIRKSNTSGVFDYKEYLKRKNTFYSVSVSSIIKVRNNYKIVYTLKNNIYNYFNHYKNGKYLKLILLGDKTGISKNVISSFQGNGISHLFAISGMHVGFITSVVMKILQLFKVRENKRYFITITLLFIYLLLIGSSPSIIRAFLFFTLLSINKIYYLNIDILNIFILTFSVVLLYNPFYIFDIGFQYSFLISFSLIICSDILNKFKNYFISLLLSSLISFFVSIPITLYNFYQINILSIFYNLFYVPFVTILLFPLSIIILIFPFFSFIYDICINILEQSSCFFDRINTFKLIFGEVNFVYYVLYLLLFLIFLKYRRKIVFLLFQLLLVWHYFYYNIFDTDYMAMLDVGQGDSFLFHSNGKNLLIDTGGKTSYIYEKWRKKEQNSLVLNTTIPYLRSRGIRRLDYLVLSHGDYDHLGEAINLINNFRIRKIYINDGRQNKLERLIIEKFNDVEVCKKGKMIILGDFYFNSLNKDLGDENSSSIVFYIVHIKSNYNFLFMGDANFNSEKYLLNNYNFPKVNILKLGHHGSKTSTSSSLLKKIKPDIALISAGKDNKFNHPNPETLKRLKKYKVKIYSTKSMGTVEFNFPKKIN